MDDCLLSPINDKIGYCPICDPTKAKPIQLVAHRNCQGFPRVLSQPQKANTRPLPPKHGPGTELKALLSRFGIRATEDCKCGKRTILMDERGEKWCEENIETIVEWLKEEATKRHLPFPKTLGKLIVKKAIRNSRKRKKREQKHKPPKEEEEPGGSMARKSREPIAVKWAYGITTVPERVDDLLPRTIASLKLGGFDKPRLFVDGAKNADKYRRFGLEVTTRDPPLKIFGNWILALAELYLREPQADRYAIFQDDLVTYKNLRQYLEKCKYPEKGYWNLYTFPENQKRAPKNVGWFLSNQRGRGAVALVFSRDAVTTLLKQNHIVDRPQSAARRRFQLVDGAVVDAFRKIGWKEYTHSPTLVQHTGKRSTIRKSVVSAFWRAVTFLGEEFDAMDLITQAIPLEATIQAVSLKETIVPEKRKRKKNVVPKRQKRKEAIASKEPAKQNRWDRFFFSEALQELNGCNDPLIVEIGAIRDIRPVAARADGHSTVHWAKSGHDVACIDLSRKALDITRKLIGSAPNVQLYQADGLEFLRGLDRLIDLLYLDGPDPKNGGPEFALKCFETAKLRERAVVLIDDCDVVPGKGDLVIPKALSTGFQVAKQDRQVLLVRKSKQSIPQNIQVATQSIGLVGYNCDSGLGELNRQLADHLNLSIWMVKPHKHYGTRLDHPGVTCSVYRMDQSATKTLVESVDVVLFCETPFCASLPSLAKEQNKRVVCIPMVEWMPVYGKVPWTRLVDLFICPTKQCYDLLSKEGYPCAYLPWPIDLARFIYHQRQQCNNFLFINGRGGWRGRKGAGVMREALELWPEMPLTVCSQTRETWPEGVRVLPHVENNADLYKEGDVLIAPHTVDGIGLEPIEAMASGVPVITPNSSPWNENLALARIPTTVTEKRIGRIMDWHICDAKALVATCKALLDSDISQESAAARQWAESRSWKKSELRSLVLGV